MTFRRRRDDDFDEKNRPLNSNLKAIVIVVVVIIIVSFCCFFARPKFRVGIMSAPPRQPPPVPARTMSMADKKKSVDVPLVSGLPVSVPLSRSPRLLRKMTSTAGGKFSETVDEDASCTTVAIGKDTYKIGENCC